MGEYIGHYVYKYVLNNEIIYIGKCDRNLSERLKQHGKKGDNIPEEGWKDINHSEIYYIELANNTMSDVVESELIRRYKPKYNKSKTSAWDGLPFVEPVWRKYGEETVEILKDIINCQDEQIKNLMAQINRFQNLIDLTNKINNITTDNKDDKLKEIISIKDTTTSLLYQMAAFKEEEREIQRKELKAAIERYKYNIIEKIYDKDIDSQFHRPFSWET